VLSLFNRFRTAVHALAKRQDDEREMSAAAQQPIGLEWDRLYSGYYNVTFKALNALNAKFVGIDRTAICVFYVDRGNDDERNRRQQL
jgi:hypothetical protein